MDDEACAAVEEALDRPGIKVVESDPLVVVADAPPGGGESGEGDVPVVAIIEQAERRRVAEALGAGAAGVVALDDVGQTLALAVASVAAGLMVLPREAHHAVRRPDLSARERQVLGLLVMGLTNAEIGQRLFLSESTVKYHLLAIYGKLGVKSRKEAASLVLDPRTGLSLGVLNVTGAERPPEESGYSGPKVT